MNANEFTIAELTVVAATLLLCICKHSKKFVEDQKALVKQLGLKKEAKEACLRILDTIEVE